MPKNYFFDNYDNSQEQKLLNDLTDEAIKIYGIDCYYIPRTYNEIDEIFEEDRLASFDNAYLVAMYLNSALGFEGQGDFVSQFGVEIRDKVTFTIAKKEFEDEIQTNVSLSRPREGDLIYFPLNRKLFQIDFVEHEKYFYQLGENYSYEMQCNLFEYSGENFNTGIPDIDRLEQDFSMDILDYVLLFEDGKNIVTEDSTFITNENLDFDQIDGDADNDEYEKDAIEFLDFSEKDPFSEKGIY